jgi:Uma2 family endonuclease
MSLTLEKPKQRATIDDLYKVEGKAELVNGEIVYLMPTGDEPGYAADEIFASLREYVRRTGFGRAVGDNKGFRANLPHRQSFSPDAAYYTGLPGGRGFFPEPPVFAVEVRSENDYGVAEEQAMETKRRDYFAGNTEIVWDVDLYSNSVIVRKFTAEGGAVMPVATFGRGEVADAEPAVPGWTMPVEDLFES